jgi:hypothetical protein
MINRMHIRLLLAAALLLAVHPVFAQKGSVFTGGFARVEINGKGWYIDTKGSKAFDQIHGMYHPATIRKDENAGHDLIDTDENETMLLVARDGKMGVVTAAGKWLLRPVYDSIELKWKTYLELRQAGKMTYADTHGKLLLPLQFQQVGILDDTHFDVKTNGKWGIYSTSGNKMIIPAIYEAFDYCGGCGSKGDYVFAQKNGKWGVVNFSNETLIPFEYEHEHFFMRSDNWVQCFKKKGKEVVLNIATKKEYAAPEYSGMEVLWNGMLKAKKNGFYGLISENGTQVTDFVYEGIESPYGESGTGPYMEVTKHKKTGIIREDGKVILPLVYNGPITCYADCFIVPVNGNYNLLDTTGKKLLAKDYSEITGMGSTFNPGTTEQLFKLKEKALYGFYNPLNQKTVAPAFFDIDRTDPESLLYGQLEVSYQEKKGLYSVAGDEILPVAYQQYGALSPELLVVKQESGIGMYDTRSRRMLIPANFYSIAALPGDSNLLEVTKYTDDNYNKGIYDVKGVAVLPAIYSSIQQVGEHDYLLTLVKNEKEQHVLFNSEGRQQIPLPYDYVKPAEQAGRLLATGKGSIGVIDTRGNIIIPVDYEYVGYLKNNKVKLLKKGTDGQLWLGYADSNGKIIVPLIYDADPDVIERADDTTYLLLTKLDPQGRYYQQGVASNSGVILVPPIYNKVLFERNGKGFLVQQGRQFRVLDRTGQPVGTHAFDDAMLGEPVGYGASSVAYSFPLLCREGTQYQYLGEDGTLLPLKLTEVISFSPEPIYSIEE